MLKLPKYHNWMQLMHICKLFRPCKCKCIHRKWSNILKLIRKLCSL